MITLLCISSGLSQKFSEVCGVQIPDFVEVVGDLAAPQNLITITPNLSSISENLTNFGGLSPSL